MSEHGFVPQSVWGRRQILPESLPDSVPFVAEGLEPFRQHSPANHLDAYGFHVARIAIARGFHHLDAVHSLYACSFIVLGPAFPHKQASCLQRPHMVGALVDGRRLVDGAVLVDEKVCRIGLRVL